MSWLQRSGGAAGAAARLLLFALVSVLAGVLVAGLALPVVGAAGVAARASAVQFENLPSVLQTPPLPQTSQILASDGTLLARIYSENRVVVPLDQISPNLQQAIVAIEDSRFYEHNGVDLRGAARAVVTNLTSGAVEEGASTLTMQYVRNVLVVSAQTAQEREAALAVTPARKLREMRLAIGLEKRESKQQILAGYLNIAFFGAGAYGAEAASRRYFSKPASKLTLSEAATLAGIVQRPVAFDPLANPKLSQGRRDVVLKRMRDLGYISPGQYAAATAIPMAKLLKPKAVPNGCSVSVAPFFCDYVLNVIRSEPAFGKTQADRDALLERGGLTIRTTLSSKTQRAAQQAVEKYIPIKDKSGKAAAIAMVQPGTGNILAMAENRHWGVKGVGNTTYNYVVDRAHGGTIGMQAGSTFKVFELAAALEKGIPINEPIPSPNLKTFSGFQSCTDGSTFPPYTVPNSTGSGTFNMRTGTALSVNTYFVELERRTGICRPAAIAESMGVATGTGQPLSRVPAFTLGVDSVTPLAMAEAYATFAAHGVHCDARAILSVTDRDGTKIKAPPKQCSPVIDKPIADAVSNLLAGVIDGPIGGRTGAAMSLGRPAAGKTGTTNDSAAVWFCGYVPQVAAAVWVGDPRGGFRYPMHNLTINGVYYSQVYGGTLPGPIWRQAMSAAVRSLPVDSFPPIDPTVIVGATVQIPDIYGLSPSDAVARLAAVGLRAEVAAERVPGKQAKDTVAYSSPKVGTTVSSGTTVTLHLSTGVPKPSPSPTPTASESASPTGSPSASPSGSQTGSPSPTGKPGGAHQPPQGGGTKPKG